MTYTPKKSKRYDKEKKMSVNGLNMTLHMPRVVKPRIVNGQEVSQGLPPARSMTAYVVDEYPACPENWMHGSDKASSYFVAVKQDRGLWFDFNDCFDHEHDVAVVISVQGVNPVTGQKQDKMRLEKYESKCPVHGCEFKQDRFCEKCKYKWPSQNYISSTDTPNGLFWLDGFRSEDGKVRQYVLTEEKLKGVAQQILGDKQTVYAIGVAFYLSKDAKPKPSPQTYDRGDLLSKPLDDENWYKCSSITMDIADNDVNVTSSGGYSIGGYTPPAGVDFGCMPPKFYSPLHTPQNWSKLDDNKNETVDSDYSCDGLTVLEGADAIRKRPEMYGLTAEQANNASDDELTAITGMASPPTSPAPYEKDTPTAGGVVSRKGAVPDSIIEPQKANIMSFKAKPVRAKAQPVRKVKIETKLEVGAGSLIDQQVYRDSKDIDYWRDEPEGFIYINYVHQNELNKILDAGKREENRDGFLTGLSRADV